MMNVPERAKKRIVTGLIYLIGFFFLLSGWLEISKNPATYPKTLQMGYPPYFIITLGIMKLAGVAALWQNKIKWLREWAFAGFVFDTIFAFISGCAISSTTDCLKAAVAAIVLLLTYFAYKKRNGLQG